MEGELVNGEILIYAKTTSWPWLASEVGRALPPPKDDPEASGRAMPARPGPRDLGDRRGHLPLPGQLSALGFGRLHGQLEDCEILIDQHR